MGIIKHHRLNKPASPSQAAAIEPSAPHMAESPVPVTDTAAAPPQTSSAATEGNTSPTVSSDMPSTTESDNSWNWEAFLAGELPDRRQAPERRNDHRRQADADLIATARQEADRIRQQAYDEGFQSGVDQAGEAMHQLADQFHALLAGKDAALEELLLTVGPLAVAAAEKILKVEVACDELLVDRLVRDTVQKAGKDVKNLVIRLHPDDEATIRQCLKDEPIPGVDINLLTDKGIAAGSCVVESNSGLIDANFHTQLNLLKKLIGKTG